MDASGIVLMKRSVLTLRGSERLIFNSMKAMSKAGIPFFELCRYDDGSSYHKGSKRLCYSWNFEYFMKEEFIVDIDLIVRESDYVVAKLCVSAQVL